MLCQRTKVPCSAVVSCYDRSINKTRVKVTVKGEHEFTGMGRSRWLAKNTAAKRALHYLKQQMAGQNVATPLLRWVLSPSMLSKRVS
ncbi:hypothetical protein D918_04466 [Trichuris suis]|nr:hypothetical protein D918_04466 [Trichuris suis]